jgi:hypothetical protein
VLDGIEGHGEIRFRIYRGREVEPESSLRGDDVSAGIVIQIPV